MAASVEVLSLSGLLCLLFFSVSFPVTRQEDNSTGYDYYPPYLYDQNFTDVDDNNNNSSATDEPQTSSPEPQTTTPLDVNPAPTDEPQTTSPPALSADPLPLSGLPAPPADGARLCPCDEQTDRCDVNCCCDAACGAELPLFTRCSVDRVSGSSKTCSQQVALYSLGSTVDGRSELHTAVRKELNYDVFCIQWQNRVEGLSHPPPTVPSARNFDSLFRRFVDSVFGSERDAVSAEESQASSGYRFGDVMAAVGETGERGVLHVPAPGITAHCVDRNPIGFLQPHGGRCSRALVLLRDCTSLPALRPGTYTGIQLLSGKERNATAVAVEMTSVTRRSVEGAESPVNISAGDQDLRPVLVSPTVCSNVVLQVGYVVRYSPAGDVVNVTASLVLGSIHGDAPTMEQEFGLVFVQENAEEVLVHSSGNPGYVVGLPLVAGSRTADGVVLSSDPGGALTVLHGATQQDCLTGPHRRTPVLFGLDTTAGCTLRLEDAVNCSLVSQVLLGVLRGQDQPQYVASFGSTRPQNPLDWVPVRNNSKPGEAQSCRIPLALHLEIRWTKYGSLINPQAQILSVTEVLSSNTSSLDSLAGGGRVISLSSSVAFVSVSQPAQPGLRAAPTVDAQLPFDFFFPFV